MAQFKLSYSDYKNLKKSISNMSQKELSNYISSIYESGYQDGVNQPIKSNESMDLEFVMIAVRATEGVGKTLSDRIRKNIENLCFREGWYVNRNKYQQIKTIYRMTKWS